MTGLWPPTRYRVTLRMGTSRPVEDADLHAAKAVLGADTDALWTVRVSAGETPHLAVLEIVTSAEDAAEAGERVLDRVRTLVSLSASLHRWVVSARDVRVDLLPGWPPADTTQADSAQH